MSTKKDVPDSNCLIKGALSGRKQFLATENTLKMMKNAFYLKIFILILILIFFFKKGLI